MRKYEHIQICLSTFYKMFLELLTLYQNSIRTIPYLNSKIFKMAINISRRPRDSCSFRSCSFRMGDSNVLYPVWTISFLSRQVRIPRSNSCSSCINPTLYTCLPLIVALMTWLYLRQVLYLTSVTMVTNRPWICNNSSDNYFRMAWRNELIIWTRLHILETKIDYIDCEIICWRLYSLARIMAICRYEFEHYKEFLYSEGLTR